MIDLVESLRAGGEQALDGHAQVGLQHVTLPLLLLGHLVVVGADDHVAALVLGQVHAGVGNLNQLGGGGGVLGESGEADGGGDLALTQQRVVSDPLAELVGQAVGLVGVGFRHQDDELVAAVAGHHVGAAHVLLQHAPDALQHRVALQVAEVVVDELELVEVEQRQRKRARNAGGTPPLARKRFHEEAMGFDSGEPVGDGLLLRFLKREGVVQGAGHHVRQGAQQQNVFVVEGAGLARFDVQHAQQLVAVDDGQAQHRSRVGQHRLDCARVLGIVHLAQGAALRHLANAAFA